MTYQVPHYINGSPIHHQTQKSRLVYNPAEGKAIGEVFFAEQALCNQAIIAAMQAFEQWAHVPAVKRARILFNFRDLLEKNQLELAKIVTKEHGKTLDDAKGSVARGIEVVEYHCGILSQLQGSYSTNVAEAIDCQTIRQPLGVCAGVSPFNFPVMVPIWMMIPAIACGNTFILKPSEQVPSAPIKLLELLAEAGLPNGVANIVQGDKNTVDFLLQNEDIKAFTSVASTPVSEYIYTQAISNNKRAHTFGGAKNHCIIMPDANIKQAAEAITGAAYGSAGERCMALSVAVSVGEQTGDRLISELLPRIKSIKIDSGDAKEVDMGPLISSTHRNKVLKLIEQGENEGAKLVVDGRTFQHPSLPHGFFLGPCLFDKVQESMSIYQQEIFGPVLVHVRVKDFESALDLINRNQYGNGTAIFTEDGHTARTFSEQVQAGMVGINVPIPVPIASHPFGGWKRSSFGDTSMHGLESVHFYTRLKSITSRWPKTVLTEKSFVMPSH